MAEGQDARVQEIREWATRALAEKSAADMPLAVAGDTVFLLARLDALTAENETAWQTLARERDSWQAEANRLTAERDELLIVSRECRESMSRATTAMARDVVTINDLKARLAAAEAANARAADRIMQDVNDLDPDDPEHPDTICISYDALDVILSNALRGADAALAGSREHAAGEGA